MKLSSITIREDAFLAVRFAQKLSGQTTRKRATTISVDRKKPSDENHVLIMQKNECRPIRLSTIFWSELPLIRRGQSVLKNNDDCHNIGNTPCRRCDAEPNAANCSSLSGKVFTAAELLHDFDEVNSHRSAASAETKMTSLQIRKLHSESDTPTHGRPSNTVGYPR